MTHSKGIFQFKWHLNIFPRRLRQWELLPIERIVDIYTYIIEIQILINVASTFYVNLNICSICKISCLFRTEIAQSAENIRKIAFCLFQEKSIYVWCVVCILINGIGVG